MFETLFVCFSWVPGQAPPQRRWGVGQQVLVPEAQQVGASALSVWLGQAQPASAALQAPERPPQQAHGLEVRRLARPAPSPDRNVVPASQRVHRASLLRPAARDNLPHTPRGAAPGL